MIRRILAGAAIAGLAGVGALALVGTASAGDYGRDYGHAPSFTYVNSGNHNEVLNDLLDVALLGIIEN
ncbi:hypothetical protein ACFOWE_17740 [Planomonospora corallina]|uniref:Uncharacterized protein n=1 Tax=Planomonospora corallina TaxID=1806052 RepID=A0ABV8IE86_9ACTN